MNEAEQEVHRAWKRRHAEARAMEDMLAEVCQIVDAMAVRKQEEAGLFDGNNWRGVKV